MNLLIPRLSGWSAPSSPTHNERRQIVRRTRYTLPSSNINYADLQPLDGEEGELIDINEACHVERDDSAPSPRLIDFLSCLPPKIALYLLCFLDLPSVIACQSVSRTWNKLANDNAVWRDLFFRHQGWDINLDRAIARGWTPLAPISEGLSETPTSNTHIPDSPQNHTPKNSTHRERTSFSLVGLSIDACDVPAHTFLHIPSFRNVPSPWSPEPPNGTHHMLTTSMNAPLSLPWRELYQSRYTSDARWTSSASQTKHLTGHTDSVHCLEFFDAHSRTANWVDSITGKTLEDPSAPLSLVSDADNGLITALTRPRTTDREDSIYCSRGPLRAGPPSLVSDTDNRVGFQGFDNGLIAACSLTRTADWVDSITGMSLEDPSGPPSLVNNPDNGLSSRASDAESSHSLRPA